MMQLERCYMHKQFMDIYFQIVDNNNWPIVLVRVMNLGYTGNPWEVEKFYECKIKDPQNWVDITDKINMKRTEGGLP